MDRLKKMYGDDFHPIMNMAKNCVDLQEKVDEIAPPEADDEGNISPEDLAEYAANKVMAIKVANAEWARIAEYTEPKLKAVEVSGDIDSTLTIVRKEYKPSK